MKRRDSVDSLSDPSDDGEVSNSGFHTPVKGLLKEMRHKRVTRREFEESTLNRFEWYEQRKQEKLLVQKKQVLLSKLEEHTQTPHINNRKSSQPPRNPLVNRLDEILESRKVRIESKKDNFVSKDDRDARECTFKPAINNTSTNRSVSDLFKWQEQKKVRLMEKSMEHDHQRRECSFKPQISKHSRQLMEKRTHNKDYQKVEDRLIGYLQKAKERQADMEESAAAQQSFMNQSHRRSQSLLGLKHKRTPNKSPSLANRRGKEETGLDTSHLLNNTTLVERSNNIFASGYDHGTFRALENQSSTHKGAQFSFKKTAKSRRSGESKKQAWLPEYQDPEEVSQDSSVHKTPRLNNPKSSKRALALSPDSDEPICKSGSKPAKSRPAKLEASGQGLRNNQPAKENQEPVVALKCPSSKKMKVQTWQKEESVRRSKSNLKHLSSQSTHQDVDSSQHQTSTLQEDSVSESIVKATQAEASKKNPKAGSTQVAKAVHVQSVLSSDRESKPTPSQGRAPRPASKVGVHKPSPLQGGMSINSSHLAGPGGQGSLGPSPGDASSHLKRTPSTSVARSTRGKENKESDLSRSRKHLVNEKYTVKVRTQVIDCKEIQETIVGGETTSMLENLKRLNTNLRKFNQLECIIKDVKSFGDKGSAGSSTLLKYQEPSNGGNIEGGSQNRFLKQLEQGLQPSAPSRPGANPFIELFAGNALSPIN